MSMNTNYSRTSIASLVALFLLTACAGGAIERLPQPASARVPARVLSAAEIINESHPSEWRDIDADNTVLMTTARGQVVIELAQVFAPLHAQNIRTLIGQGYFDGLAIVRSQDNFVVQWGDPHAEDPAKRKSLGAANATVAAEFTAKITDVTQFTLLPDGDGYAKEVGFSEGFAVGRDPRSGEVWPTHCYGVVGAGRDVAIESGSGAELYVVTGHAPRQLDRNIAVVGRVIAGIEYLSTIERGPAPMGFYTDPAARTAILSVQLASQMPEADRPRFQALRTDSASFAMLVEARRNRRDDWYKRPAGHIDLCNVPLPVRITPAP